MTTLLAWESCGNGAFVELVYADGRVAFLQGDDAARAVEELDDAGAASIALIGAAYEEVAK